jgi:hypothetical protein
VKYDGNIYLRNPSRYVNLSGVLTLSEWHGHILNYISEEFEGAGVTCNNGTMVEAQKCRRADYFQLHPTAEEMKTRRSRD